MSIELFEDEVKKKHLASGGFSGSGRSPHELGAKELLYPYVESEKEDSQGNTKVEREIQVDAKTELPSPANTTVLERYGDYLDMAFGKGSGKGMRIVNERYKINMISKNRKGRQEFTMVSTASALNPSDESNSDKLMKEVQKS